MRRQDIELFNKLFAALEDDQIFLDAHMSLSKMSVIVPTIFPFVPLPVLTASFLGRNVAILSQADVGGKWRVPSGRRKIV